MHAIMAHIIVWRAILKKYEKVREPFFAVSLKIIIEFLSGANTNNSTYKLISKLTLSVKRKNERESYLL